MDGDGWPATLTRDARFRPALRSPSVARGLGAVLAVVLMVPGPAIGLWAASDQPMWLFPGGSGTRAGGFHGTQGPVQVLGGLETPAHSLATLTEASPAGPSPDASVSVQISASPRRGHIPLVVNLNSTARGNSHVLEYNFTWHFGDGSPPVVATVNVTAGAAGATSTSHTYTQVGTYTANVTVSDGVDSNASALTVITATLPLTATATAVPTAVTVGRPVLLLGNASGGSPPYTFIWSGVPSGCGVSGQNLSCVPTVVGPYSVRLQVSDSIPNYASAFVGFTVNGRMSLGVSYTSWYHCAGSTDFLTDNFTGTVKGGTAPYRFSWNPGDGGSNQTGANVSHVYVQSTLFNVSLTVTDASGAVANRTLPISTSFVACGGLPPVNPLVTPALVGGTIAAAVAVGVLGFILYRGLSRGGRPPSRDADSATATREGAPSPSELDPSVPEGASGPNR